MGLSVEEQRQKQRDKRLKEPKRKEGGVWRLINGKLKYLSKGSNRAYNKKIHKKPRMLYDYNTNK